MVARVIRELTPKVYNAPTVLRLAQFEARKLGRNEAIFVVLHPTGKSVGVVASGTGRRVVAGAARRAKRDVESLLPELAPKRRRRTSRKVTSQRRTSKKPTNRRTSRRRASHGRRVGRRR
jgi:hypothetical protein